MAQHLGRQTFRFPFSRGAGACLPVRVAAEGGACGPRFGLGKAKGDIHSCGDKPSLPPGIGCVVGCFHRRRARPPSAPFPRSRSSSSRTCAPPLLHCPMPPPSAPSPGQKRPPVRFAPFSLPTISRTCRKRGSIENWGYSDPHSRSPGRGGALVCWVVRRRDSLARSFFGSEVCLDFPSRFAAPTPPPPSSSPRISRCVGLRATQVSGAINAHKSCPPLTLAAPLSRRACRRRDFE